MQNHFASISLVFWKWSSLSVLGFQNLPQIFELKTIWEKVPPWMKWVEIHFRIQMWDTLHFKSKLLLLSIRKKWRFGLKKRLSDQNSASRCVSAACCGLAQRPVFVSDRSWTPLVVCSLTSENIPANCDAALSRRSIWSLSAAPRCTRLAESYLTISCSIHEWAIMYKRVSKAYECAPRLPGGLLQSFFLQGGNNNNKKSISIPFHIKKRNVSPRICPHTFSRHLLSHPSSQYANEDAVFFSSPIARFLLCLAAISCRGGFHLVPGLFLWLVVVVVVVVVGYVPGCRWGRCQRGKG